MRRLATETGQTNSRGRYTPVLNTALKNRLPKLAIGDQVLVRAPKLNKLSSNFDAVPRTVVAKHRGGVTIERDGAPLRHHIIQATASSHKPLRCHTSHCIVIQATASSYKPLRRHASHCPPDRLTYWYAVLSFKGGECRIARSFLRSARCFWPRNACSDYLTVRYDQFIHASVLCGNASFCVVALSGVLMLTAINLYYCFRESYFWVDKTFQ